MMNSVMLHNISKKTKKGNIRISISIFSHSEYKFMGKVRLVMTTADESKIMK